MRLSELEARNNKLISGLNKFIGMQYSEKTKSHIIQHITLELSKYVDSHLSEFIKYDIVESFGKYAINPHNLFTALLFNGLYYPESINYKDTFEIEWGTFSINGGVLYYEEKPLEEVRELRLNEILNRH